MKRYFLKHYVRFCVGILITGIALWLQIAGGTWSGRFIDRLDNLAYDMRLTRTLPASRSIEDSKVIIVDIDEDSLRAEGRWPWSRAKMGELVSRLKAAGVKTIGFDVAFTEPERNVAQELIDAASASGQLEHAEYLETLIPDMDRDAIFAQYLKAQRGQDVVLGFILHAQEDESVGALPSGWAYFPEQDNQNLSIPIMRSYTGNLRELQKSARHGGFLNTTTDEDGVLRRTPLILRSGDMVYPSLALAMARRHSDAKRFKVDTAEVAGSERVTALQLEDKQLPTDQYGRVLIPYTGHRGGVPYISATEIFQTQDFNEFPELENAAVLIGSSALGLADLISAPTGPAFPGVEVHATVLKRILSGQPFPQEPDWANAANALVILVSGLLLTIVCPALGALAITLVAVASLTFVVGADVWLWNAVQLSLSPVLPLFTIVGIIGANVLWGYFAEARQKRQVRKAFSSYMAPALVDQLVEHPEQLQLTGEEREMTFLFSDIAGFTTFSERAGPQLLVTVLNQYLDAMCRAVMEHGGTIDKIVGDAVVGIFNAPLDQPDHAQRAVNCALAMDKISKDFIQEMNDKGMPFGATRVGVNTGLAIVGNFGGSERFDYTAHGDPINTAARLEGVNKHLGTLMCISGTTVAQCRDHYFRPVGALVLKGKTEAIEAFEPITEEESETQWIQRYNAAFQALADGVDGAKEQFAALRDEYPDDPLVKLHYERIMQGTISTTIVMAEK